MEELIIKYAAIPPRQRYAGAVAIAVVLLGAYYSLFYVENVEVLESLQSNYEKLERDRNQQEGFLNNLAKYEARLNELQQNLATAKAQLPDDPDVPQLLSQLGNKARQSGVAIERFLPQEETQKGFYAEIAFEVAVVGSYHEIATFIDSIGKLDRIVNVANISMTNPKTINQKVILSSTITVKTYRFLSDAEQAKSDKTQAKGKGRRR